MCQADGHKVCSWDTWAQLLDLTFVTAFGVLLARLESSLVAVTVLGDDAPLRRARHQRRDWDRAGRSNTNYAVLHP